MLGYAVSEDGALHAEKFYRIDQNRPLEDTLQSVSQGWFKKTASAHAPTV